MTKMRKFAIIVHGGAWAIPDVLVQNHIEGCKKAIKMGSALLKNEPSALDTVEEAVKTMENDSTYDAGRGSFLNQIGEVELDAMIVDGKNLTFGAVAAVRNLYHPVSLARKVMEETEHIFLVGKGAETFAKSIGIELIPTELLLVGRELERWQRLKNPPNFKAKGIFESNFPNNPFGIVGEVTVDFNGNLATVTSKG